MLEKVKKTFSQMMMKNGDFTMVESVKYPPQKEI